MRSIIFEYLWYDFEEFSVTLKHYTYLTSFNIQANLCVEYLILTLHDALEQLVMVPKPCFCTNSLDDKMISNHLKSSQISVILCLSMAKPKCWEITCPSDLLKRRAKAQGEKLRVQLHNNHAIRPFCSHLTWECLMMSDLSMHHVPGWWQYHCLHGHPDLPRCSCHSHRKHRSHKRSHNHHSLQCSPHSHSHSRSHSHSCHIHRNHSHSSHSRHSQYSHSRYSHRIPRASQAACLTKSLTRKTRGWVSHISHWQSVTAKPFTSIYRHLLYQA